MLSDKEIEQKMDQAEKEINDVLDEHGLYLGVMYEEGVSVTIGHQQEHPSGDLSIRERELK